MSAPLLLNQPRANLLEHWDPRLRILVALLWALTVVSLHHSGTLLLAFVAVLFALVRLELLSSALLRRLLPLETLMLLLLMLLPFTLQRGGVWFQFGPLTAYWSGLERALGVTLKANSVVLALFPLVGTLSQAELAGALSRLGTPHKLVLLLQLTLRYIGVLQLEYQRLRQAMMVRAFRLGSDLHSLKTLGWLIGMLLVRSLERSERVLAAMKCRGFDGRLPGIGERLDWRVADTTRALLSALLLAVLVGADLLLG